MWQKNSNMVQLMIAVGIQEMQSNNTKYKFALI